MFRFERWRKLMLAGAVVLLVNAIFDAMTPGEPPEWLTVAAFMVGYGFLIAGFGVRMWETKEARAKREGTSSGP